MKFVLLPLAKPTSAKITFAMLAARSQDASPPTPDEIFLTVMQGGRVFVAHAPVRRKFVPVLGCAEARRKQEKAADDAYAADEAAGKTDDKPFNRYAAMREDAEVQFLRCFAGQATKQAAFADAVKQAQALLESLPLR
jgi:hypothetical protein